MGFALVIFGSQSGRSTNRALAHLVCL